MHKPQRDDQRERMKHASENLKRILEELAPYEKRVTIKELSTAGTWQASHDVSFDASDIEIEHFA
jgi:hypothetical protein